ncbi:ATP-dependent endonuclease [Streptomyces rochei]|uniref:ATP-dependent nuclease n=1 Tax=Streptomyces rochei TaxID=1928 RepID=UPI00363092B0
MFGFSVESAHFINADVVDFPDNGMTVFVGPNNAGKSALLRELAERLTTYPHLAANDARWINSVTVLKSGEEDDFLSWLQKNGMAPLVEPNDGRRYYAGPAGSDTRRISEAEVRSYWANLQAGPIAHFLVSQQWTENRLQDQTTSHQWNQDFQPPSHPTQYLWADRGQQDKFSSLTMEAFGVPVAINRYEQQINLQIGGTGLPDEPPPASAELRAAYRALPLLSQQGDGMRSFVNIVLHCLVRPSPVVVIDEPEAFLHPPQAHLLGRYLAERTPSPCQLIVATHSLDFLNGVMESGIKDVALVRISRAESSVSTNSLDFSEVKELSEDPFFRYSSILSGLFHDGVVICEAEGDCRFYSSVFEVAGREGRHQSVTFMHVNGKARLGKAVERLRKFGLPVAAIADIDLLNDKAKMRQTISSFGGAWERVATDLNTLHSQMNAPGASRTVAEVRKEISDIIGRSKGNDVLTQFQIEKIREAVRRPSRWSDLKRSGSAMLSGESYLALVRLLKYSASLGLFIVPVGELESWVKDIPSSDKGRWLSQVFEHNLHLDPSEQLKEFTRDVAAHLFK